MKTKLKKSLAFLLSAILIMSTANLLTFTSFAETFAEKYASAKILPLNSETDVEYGGTEETGVLRFTPDKNGKYTFYSSGDFDTYITLFNSDGNRIDYNDDGGENNNFRLNASLEAGNTYYLFTRLYSASSSGNYSVTAINFDDLAAGARNLAPGGTLTVNYNGTVTSGLLKFTPNEDSIYIFYSSGDIDTRVELYDESGNSYDSDDDGGEDDNFKLSVELESGHTYYLFTKASDTGTYTVTATTFKNSVAGARALTLGGTLTVNYNGTETSGLLKFTPSEDGRFVFYSSGELDTYIRLYDEYGYSYDSDDDGGENDNFKLSAGLESGHTYYLFTKAYDIGTYTVTAINFDDLVAGARALTLGGTLTVNYNGTETSGLLKFTPSEDGRFVFYSSGDLDTCVELYDEYGNYYNSNDNGGEDNNFKLSAGLESGHTYYLFTKAYDIGTYTVTATTFKNSVAGARALTLGGTLTVNYNGTETSGLLKFTPSEDGRFVFYSSGDLDTYIRLYDEYGYSYDSDDDGGENCNFKLSVELEAGYTYYLFTKAYDIGTYTVTAINYADTLIYARPLTLDNSVHVEYDGSESSGLLKFTPEEDGTYYFYSSSDSLEDTYAVLRNKNGYLLSESDDFGASLNFLIVYNLSANETCYLFTSSYSDYSEFDVTVSKTAPEFSKGYDLLKEQDLSGKTINLVLAVDTTGSMGWVVDNVRRTLTEFVSALSDTNAQLRISLIDYKDIIEDGYNSTVLHYSSKSAIWFENSDIDDLLDHISRLEAIGGGDNPESVLDVLGNVVVPEVLTFNSKAAKFAFLITDADYKPENTHGISDMDDLIARLNDIGVSTSVITTKEYFDCYRSLADETGGILINLGSEFSDAMAAFAASIASGTADYTPDSHIIPVSRITLGKDLEIPVGKIRSFTARIYPSNATNPNIVWSVEDETIAKIDENTTNQLLVIQGISEGSTRVIARSMDGGYVATFDLTTSNAVETDTQVLSCDIDTLIGKIIELAAEESSTEIVYYNDNSEDTSIPAEKQLEVFTTINDTDLSVTFVYDDSYGDMLYKWTFSGVEIVDPEIPVNMDISLDAEDSPVIETASDLIVDTTNAKTIDFSHDGDLPGTAEVSIAVDLADGTYILYYFDPVEKTFANAGNAVVKDGVATFKISHCSSYIITDQEKICNEGHGALIHYSKNIPTINADGNIEYWKCQDCGKCFLDSQGTVGLSIEQIIDAYITSTGDINSDGIIDNKDITRLFQYLSEWDVEVASSALDINGDGELNNKDLTRLFQYLTGWSVRIK